MYKRNLLTQIFVGMTIYDSGHAYIGTVENVHEAVPMLASSDVDMDTKREHICHVLDQYIVFSDSLTLHLFHEGFVHARGGMIPRDIIVLPSQIDQIVNDTVHLNVQVVKRKALRHRHNTSATAAAASV